MAAVTVKGILMGVVLDSRTFDGQTKNSVLIDLYQKDSPLRDKAVQVKSEDLTHFQLIKDRYAEGEEICLECTVNAYKNDAYFKLLKFA